MAVVRSSHWFVQKRSSPARAFRHERLLLTEIGKDRLSAVFFVRETRNVANLNSERCAYVRGMRLEKSIEHDGYLQRSHRPSSEALCDDTHNKKSQSFEGLRLTLVQEVR
jgi:hypothetical protein